MQDNGTTTWNGTVPTGGNETLPNGTTIDVGNGHSGVVEQGPVWLAELLYAPPEWLVWTVNVLLVLGLALVAVLAWRVVRDLDEDERIELLEEYCQLALIIGSIAIAASSLAKYAEFPYLVDVFGGTTLGFAFAQAVLHGLPRVLPGDTAMADGSKD